MRRVLFICVLLLSSVYAHAQHSSASQNITLQLRGAIEIARISQQDIANYEASGKNGQQFLVRSNRKFNISVQQLANESMNKSISISVAQNNTGGAATASQKLTGANQQLIANANLGNEQTFAVNYNATSLREDVGVVYTATNP